MEGRTLHPRRDERGVMRFVESELPERKVGRTRAPVDRAAGKEPAVNIQGELAAQVFEAFASGMGLRHIVMRFRVEPAKVRQLFADWHLDLIAGERQRRENGRAKATAKEQRERSAWMQSLRNRKSRESHFSDKQPVNDHTGA